MELEDGKHEFRAGAARGSMWMCRYMGFAEDVVRYPTETLETVGLSSLGLSTPIMQAARQLE